MCAEWIALYVTETIRCLERLKWIDLGAKQTDWFIMVSSIDIARHEVEIRRRHLRDTWGVDTRDVPTS